MPTRTAPRPLKVFITSGLRKNCRKLSSRRFVQKFPCAVRETRRATHPMASRRRAWPEVSAALSIRPSLPFQIGVTTSAAHASRKPAVVFARPENHPTKAQQKPAHRVGITRPERERRERSPASRRAVRTAQEVPGCASRRVSEVFQGFCSIAVFAIPPCRG